MRTFKLNEEVTRLELTQLLCKEEIESGLINEEKPLMMTSIIDSRFIAYTGKKLRINWNGDLNKTGVVVEISSNSFSEDIATIDTSEYDEN